jgi:hypothetical protein
LKKILLFFILSFAGIIGHAQYTFSIATDLNLLHNFTKNEGFNAVGQTVHYQFHFTKKETAYGWLSYHRGGRFKNNLSAVAKDSITSPQRLNYRVSSSINLSQISLGWKHYFRGGSNEEDTWGVYSTAGFGLLFAKVTNTFDKRVDTAKYASSKLVLPGATTINKLTIDLGLGGEFSVAPGLFLYSEIRTWLPASSYPSPYLYNNDLPRVLLLNAGLRILFD